MIYSLATVGAFGSYSQNSPYDLHKHNIYSKSNTEQAQPMVEDHLKATFITTGLCKQDDLEGSAKTMICCPGTSQNN